MNFFQPIWSDQSIDRLFEQICKSLLHSPSVNTGHWQAKKDVPQTKTRELRNVVLELPIAATSGAWAAWMRPNLPWAEDHFLERVGGQPLNPPPSHVNWPYNQQDNKDHMDGEVFSHSYPERLWPRYAPQPRTAGSPSDFTGTLALRPYENSGIRYRYGDLGDLVALLVREPRTRQAYIPLWFPEDLAATIREQRVPCTLGYHFLLRENRLHCFYPMRSLDVLRYFRDDVYMGGRLTQWVIQQCQNKDTENSLWHEIQPGLLTLHAVSCHCFEGDIPFIRKMLAKKGLNAATR